MHLYSSIDTTSSSSLAKRQIDFLFRTVERERQSISGFLILSVCPDAPERNKAAHRSPPHSCNCLCAPCSRNGKENGNWLWGRCLSKHSPLTRDLGYAFMSRLWFHCLPFLFLFFPDDTYFGHCNIRLSFDTDYSH